MLSGSEEGWANASHDSRRDQKQKDIKRTVDALIESDVKQKQEWESKLEDELTAATLETVLKGGVNCVGSTAAYRRNFEKAFGRE